MVRFRFLGLAFVWTVFVACERAPSALDDDAAVATREPLGGQFALVTVATQALGDSVHVEAFFARYHGLTQSDVIDSLDATRVAQVLDHRPGECWRGARRSTRRGEITLLDVGAISVASQRSVALDSRVLPPLIDKLSGTLYRSAKPVAIDAAHDVVVHAAGDAMIGAFDLRLRAPAPLHAKSPSGFAPGKDVVVTWNTEGVLGDAVVLSLGEGQSALHCVAADRGVFAIPAALLDERKTPVERIKIVRVRLSSFVAPGIEAAHAAFTTEEELAIPRAE